MLTPRVIGEPRRDRGFTLIEMAITFVVIGILMAALMPSIGNWMRATRVRNVAESLQNGIQQARNEAVKRNAPVSFSLVSLTDARVMDNSCALSSTGQGWVVSQNNPAGSCASAPSDTTAPRIVVAEATGSGGEAVQVAATLQDGATAANQITFNGFGLVTNGGAIQRLTVSMPNCDDCRTLRIEVTNSGSIRMCDEGATAADDPRRCRQE